MILAKKLIFAASLLPFILTQETVLGVYIFYRYSDCTSKSWPPASLTDLSYTKVFSSGNFYCNCYIDTSASSTIIGINSNVVKNS
jgi:hypothetical protein